MSERSRLTELMASAPVRSLGPLVVWTLFVWVSRIRNIWADDELSTGGQLFRTGYSVVFVGFAVFFAQRLWARRSGNFTAGELGALAVFCVWTVGFWLVRGIGIIADDHETGFTIVHTVLMVISIALAWRASRLLSRRATDRWVAV